MPLFDPDKGDTEQDQHDGNRPGVVQMRLAPVVQQQTDHSRRHCCHNDLAPHLENVLFQTSAESGLRHGVRIVLFAKGPKLVPVDDHDRQNCAQLNHNIEHFLEIIGCVQL